MPRPAHIAEENKKLCRNNYNQVKTCRDKHSGNRNFFKLQHAAYTKQQSAGHVVLYCTFSYVIKKVHIVFLGKWWRLYMYIYCLFYFAQKNTTKTQLGLVISCQTKLRECLSDFLGLTNFLRLEEMVDQPKLLKFGSACLNWPDAIGINTKVGESTIFKAKTE